MIHSLKTNEENFKKYCKGRTVFEIRKEDKLFCIGDYVALNEWNGEKYTGKCVLFEIRDVIDDSTLFSEGNVILSLEPCKIKPVDVLRRRNTVVYDRR